MYKRQILILRKIHKIFLNDLSDLLKSLSKLSLKTKDDLMAGRTHGQHALPITFGYKVACWIDEISRHIERIKESEPRVFKCIFGGAVGTSASFGKYGNKLQKNMVYAILEKNSLEVNNPINEKFDPNLHQAIKTIENDKKDDNTVDEVLQKGYKLVGRVIKPALVVVIKN